MIIAYVYAKNAHDLLLRSVIGQAMGLLGAPGLAGRRERTLDVVARLLDTKDAARRDEAGPLTPADYADAVVSVARQFGGQIQYELAADQIRFTCATCVIDEDRAQETLSLCWLWWESLRRIAVDWFGYGKVVWQARIVTGSPQCDLRLYLRRTAEAEAAEGLAFPNVADRPTEPGGDRVRTPDETIRQLQARVRVLEQRTSELEQALEDRKLIEKAKGLLMARLTLTEPEAMQRLQKESQRRNKRLADLARIIVEAGEIL